MKNNLQFIFKVFVNINSILFAPYISTNGIYSVLVLLLLNYLYIYIYMYCDILDFPW
jgi:hypothetical protein